MNDSINCCLSPGLTSWEVSILIATLSELNALVWPMSMVISVGPKLTGSTPKMDSASRYSPFEKNDFKSEAEPTKWLFKAKISESSTCPLLYSELCMLSEYVRRFRHQLLDERLSFPMLSNPHRTH